MITINYLTPAVVDYGALRLLPAVLVQHNIRRPLIITDKGIVAAGLLDCVTEQIAATQAGIIFDATPANPTEAAVEDATALYRAGECDGMIAVGGGSPLDLAKAVALMATHPGPLSRYAGMAAMPLITAAAAPVIAIPTTSGTGSEVGRGALICLSDGRKVVIASTYLLPRHSLCDPALTFSLPPRLTAGTGMDALTHCIETFLSPRINPPADAIALDGAARAWQWLATAVAEPENRQARWEMMMASIQGGLAFQKGLGAVHALAHPLGALRAPSLHHGTVNAVLLPHVLAFNEGHAGNKYDRLRAACGLNAGANLAEEVRKLNAKIGMPSSLAQLGVPGDVADAIAQAALLDHSTPTNPRPLSKADFLQIFQAALH